MGKVVGEGGRAENSSRNVVRPEIPDRRGGRCPTAGRGNGVEMVVGRGWVGEHEILGLQADGRR